VLTIIFKDRSLVHIKRYMDWS